MKELTLQQATLGIGYSANTGPRFTLEHYHRRVFGQPWIAHNKFELGPSLKSFGTELTSYPLEDQYRNILAASGEHAAHDRGGAHRLHRPRGTAPRTGRASSASTTSRRSTPASTATRFVTQQRSGLGQLQLDPARRRQRAAADPRHHAQRPGRPRLRTGTQFQRGARHRDRRKGPFVRAYGRLTWYQPFGATGTRPCAVEAGQVFAKSRIAVPDTILFRAGGEDSVRGYGYRTLGPKIYGETASGRVLMTASAEIAHPISPIACRRSGGPPSSMPATPPTAGATCSPVLGYGAGVRWRSPVGPLSVDLAYGQAVRQFRLHVSVGVTF